MTSPNALIGGSLMIRYHRPSGLKHLVVLPQLSERASLCLKVFSRKGENAWLHAVCRVL